MSAAWLRTGLVVLAGLILAMSVVGFVRDPFGWRTARAERQAAELAVQAHEAAARGLEVEGERASARRTAVVLSQAAAAQAAVSVLTETARRADDAAIALDPERARRLRAHDDELCRLAPTLGGCAAAEAGVAADGG